MASFLAKQVSKRVLKESTANNFGSQVTTSYHLSMTMSLTTAQDAYYEQVPATDLNGNPTGKMVKRKRAVPDGISPHDAKILNKVKRRAHRLDSNINICGIRFGWSSVIGIIPGWVLRGPLTVLFSELTLPQVRRRPGRIHGPDGLPHLLQGRRLGQ